MTFIRDPQKWTNDPGPVTADDLVTNDQDYEAMALQGVKPEELTPKARVGYEAWLEKRQGLRP